MTFVANLRRQVFAPPYPLLPLAVFATLVLLFILSPHSLLRHFALSDTDDYTRLTQVMNWLAGQGWYDLGQPRLSPGDGTVIHWSRLVDLPLAAVALLLKPLFGLRAGFMAAAFVVPIVLLGLILLPLVTSMMRPFVPRARINLAAVMVIFASSVLFNFSPGRVDHHAYQIAINGFGFISLIYLVHCPRRWEPAIAAALSFAAGLWIGGEVFPGLTLFGIILGVMAAWRGGILLSRAALFGGVLALSAIAVLPLARPWGEWERLEITWFSGAYVLFAVLLGATLILTWFGGRYVVKRELRLALFAALGFMDGALFFLIVPNALAGPYANFELLSAPMVLGHVTEAQPLAGFFRGSFSDASSFGHATVAFLQLLFLPFAGLGVVAWNVLKNKTHRRLSWLLLGAYLLVFLLLSLFWQARVSTHMQLLMLVPVTWFVWRLWDIIARYCEGRARFWAEILAFSILVLIPIVLLPGMAASKPLYPDILLFPASRGKPVCSIDLALAVLNDPEGYGKRPRVILSSMNDGPTILFRTQHIVLSAPYNVKSNRDSFDFFNARLNDQAEGIARRRGVDLVLLCRKISAFYTGVNETTRFYADLKTDSDGKLHMLSDKDHPTMIERLLHDKAPAWLKRVEIPFDKDYLLYEVVLTEEKKKEH